MEKLNKIVLSDCFEYIDSIDSEYVDLAVIDPPYFLNKGDWDKFNSEEDFFDFTYRWIDAIIPKLKKGASIYIFNTPYNSAFILSYLIKKGLNFQNWITWDKRDGFTYTKKRFIPNQETILFFSKGNLKVFNADDVRIEYESKERMKHATLKGILKKDGTRWFPNEHGKLCGDVWHIASERHKNKINGKVIKIEHATPKPLEMIERIIQVSSNKDDVVLDCFVGTGTTAIVSKKLERNFLCCDSNLKYVELANEKLSLLEQTYTY